MLPDVKDEQELPKQSPGGRVSCAERSAQTKALSLTRAWLVQGTITRSVKATEVAQSSKTRRERWRRHDRPV